LAKYITDSDLSEDRISFFKDLVFNSFSSLYLAKYQNIGSPRITEDLEFHAFMLFLPFIDFLAYWVAVHFQRVGH
jgi:hypothetical protein